MVKVVDRSHRERQADNHAADLASIASTTLSGPKFTVKVESGLGRIAVLASDAQDPIMHIYPAKDRIDSHNFAYALQAIDLANVLEQRVSREFTVKRTYT
jgi:hypothetical protein